MKLARNSQTWDLNVNHRRNHFPPVLVPASKVLKNDLFLPTKTLWDSLHQKEPALLLPGEKVLGAAVTLGLREAEHKSQPPNCGSLLFL